tara:strand:+ start:1124 stop:1819 length:696 start_codon:yes stop_codon:yes gene_type:complete
MVDIHFRALFPSPFGFVNFGEEARELNKIIVKNIDEELVKFQPNTAPRTFTRTDCAWQSNLGMELLYDSFAKLGDAISSCIGPIITQSGFKQDYAEELIVSNMWANVILAPGGFSEPHIHGSGRTLWSGVYFPQSDHENLDDFDVNKFIIGGNASAGNLVIRDPAFIPKSLIKVKGKMNNREYYGAPLTVIPRESLLILFPAWLEHYVVPITDDKRRYSISFGINKKEEGK